MCCVGYTLLRSLCLKQEAVGPYGDDLVLGRVLEGHADLGIPSLGLEVLFSIEELMSGEQEVVLRERCDTTASLKARLQKLLNEVENLAVLFLLHLPRLPSIPLVLLPLR